MGFGVARGTRSVVRATCKAPLVVGECPSQPVTIGSLERSPMLHSSRPLHHFTIDVEEYFQVVALEPYVGRDRWTSMESRVQRAVDELVELLAETGTRATCFTLGWIAERYPGLVRGLAAAGHEVASHGWDHVRVTHQGPAAFRTSVRQTKQVLEDITGTLVQGFRAPSFSIVKGHEWALDVLLEEGYRYDSSLFPVRRPDGYGYVGTPRDPFLLTRESGTLLELPMATLRFAGMNLPAAGGGYFRLLPYALVSAAFRACEQRGSPGMFYIHPWELDAEQPRLGVSGLARVRHYSGLSRTHGRLQRLLREFRFRPVADFLGEIRSAHESLHGATLPAGVSAVPTAALPAGRP
jgi:polysaccharide deacetylase family protein (PEP-CTERM system associated)